MTFDLEKARKIVGAMSPTPWIVLEDRYGQIDVIRNPNHPMHKESVIELWGRASETATPDAIGISYMRSEFPNALDEIERLRADIDDSEKRNEDLRKGIDDLSTTIFSVEANCIYDPETGKVFVPDGHPELEKLRARNRDLEDTLVEERARALWFEGDDPCDPPNLDWKTEPNDIPESVRLLWGESARQQLQAEGKIGPDAKPHCWQITEEREAAIDRSMRFLAWSNAKTNDPKTYMDLGVLQAMLEEVGQ